MHALRFPWFRPRVRVCDGEWGDCFVLQALSETPGILNEDPEGAGWFMKMKITGEAPDTLMDPAAYDHHCKKQG